MEIKAETEMVKRSRRATSTTLQAMNFKALITSVAALSLAFAGGTFAPEAKAWDTRCRTNFGTTRCTGSDGSSYRSRSDSFGGTRFSGYDSNGNSYSGRCRTTFGTTRCSSY